MMKQIFKKHSGDVKIVEKSNEEKNVHSIYMAFNQGGSLPIVIPPISKNECIEGYSCDRFR